ncbi:MAG: SDR family NAD(P)-dependent oxidoreductase [Cryomorphaceae bacterium]|jgi:short-subunit dehydrogenase|nr:SDR family NAD(P)-dependent oxidoreductase [Cryomorphaceae bacterium]
MRNSYALVTGATSGIGLEISRDLAKRGYNLILIARTSDKLNVISKELIGKFNIKCDCFSSDLTKISAPNEIYDFTKSNNYNIDVLVNNAGYALPKAFHENSMEDEEKCLRVLGTSVIALTKKYINDMISNGGGKIMIVSSVAAFAPASSLQSLYGPVKTFMNRFSESLSFYNKYGITSTAVCPGYTVTNFHTASGVQKEMDSVPSFLKKSAKRIAQEGVDAMLKGKKVCVPTKTWKIIVFLLKVIPQSVFSLISGLLAPGRYDEV